MSPSPAEQWQTRSTPVDPLEPMPAEWARIGDALVTALAQAEQERDAAEAARDEVFAVIERQHVQSSDQQVNEELHAARAEVVALTQERDAAHATLGSMDKELEEYISDVLELSAERDAYKRAKSENDERFMLERDVARADSRIWEKIAHRECQRVEATQAEVVALRTALETINVGTNDKWVLAIARAALGSTNEPKETQTSKWRQAIGAVPRDEDGPRAEAVIRKIRDATNEPEETGT